MHIFIHWYKAASHHEFPHNKSALTWPHAPHFNLRSGFSLGFLVLGGVTMPFCCLSWLRLILLSCSCNLRLSRFISSFCVSSEVTCGEPGMSVRQMFGFHKKIKSSSQHRTFQRRTEENSSTEILCSGQTFDSLAVFRKNLIYSKANSCTKFFLHYDSFCWLIFLIFSSVHILCMI